MKSRNIMIAAVALAFVSTVLFVIALIVQSRMPEEVLPAPHGDVMLKFPEPTPGPAADYSQIAAQDIFSRMRGQTAAPAGSIGQASPPPAAEELQMLPGYPNEWPRLKLTGVFMLGGRPGAVIAGGDALPVSSGDRYSRLYRVGDEIGGGVSLLIVRERSVVLKSAAGCWEIMLGAEPPVVPVKK